MKKLTLNPHPAPRAAILAALLALFVAIEIGFWVAVQFNFPGKNHIIDYASVIVAVAFGLASAAFNPRDEWLLRLGLVFTLLADYHLVYTYPMDMLLGMVYFNITQLSYFLYLLRRDNSRGRRVAHVSVRLALIGVALLLTFLVLGEGADPLSVTAMIYFANLATSVIWCLLSRRWLLFAGLLAFALCDVTVGMQNLIDLYMDVPDGSLIRWVVDSDFNFTWFFYVPSQTLIALCTLGDQGRDALLSLFKKK